jgi:hypothetical protein
VWRRWRQKGLGVRLHGIWYCLPECLERALAEALPRLRSLPGRAVKTSHRVPLGLLLLSRQQLTIKQLRVALKAQRAAGCGKIGEWLQRLGFVDEQQVTAALARQWSCPLLATNAISSRSGRIPEIPLLLLQSFGMMPVSFVALTTTLHVAFADGIDYTALYAIERMLGCHTVPCLATPSRLHAHLRTLAERRTSSEVVFERVADAAEFVRIVRSYATRVCASEIHMAYCGSYIWIRLECISRPSLSLLLSTPA